MDIDKIPSNVLDAVREHLGDDGNDTRFDNRISKMSPKEIMHNSDALILAGVFL